MATTLVREIPPVPRYPFSLEHILTRGVFRNWEALTASLTSGQVKSEYHIGADGAVESLRLWGSTREYWSLICNYSVNPAWSDGPSFSNGYHSRALGRLLQSIMMNQNLFHHACRPNSNGTLHIAAPSPQETDDARLRVSETFQRAF
jgi:hypothetical protein